MLQVSTNAKPLNVKSKMVADSDLCKMKCWPFGIVEGCPKDKDERVDDSAWEVMPGMALRYLFISSNRHAAAISSISLLLSGLMALVILSSNRHAAGSCSGRKLREEARRTSSRAA